VKRYIRTYRLKPSDAIHVAVMEANKSRHSSNRGHRVRQNTMDKEAVAKPVGPTVYKLQALGPKAESMADYL